MKSTYQSSLLPASTAVSVEAEIMDGVPCLDAASLAVLLGCAPHHVLHQLAKRFDFPRPLVDLSCRLRYWRAADVLRWLHQPGSTRVMCLADLTAPRLDTDGLADLLGCTRQHAADHIATRADFPLPCINVSRRMRFWLYRDVLQWVTHGNSKSCSDARGGMAELLNAADVARLLGCTCKKVGNQIAKSAGFPAPAFQVSRRLRYWRTSDVQEWRRKGGAA